MGDDNQANAGADKIATGKNAGAAAALRIAARDLFRHAREVLIDHEGQVYRLRLTRQNRLILNK